ncbi:MAG: uroporphyrinogen decarboxylase family protein [Candidatus Jordarchaeum sp.]|uniref:uroporphyrinogen decarboxylase family protein n=1 Tax=Candidatus Jordarchaeum sp. TaxID=2823881 RepID=UPI00404909B1
MPLKMHENETMTPRERMETVLDIKEPDRVPAIIAFHAAQARLTGMTIEEFFFDVPKSFEATKKVWEMFGGFDVYTGCSPILGYYLPWPNSHSMIYFNWTLPKGNITEQMHEKELMKRSDYDLVIEKGFAPFKRRPELEKDFMNYVGQFAALDTGSWLKEMDVPSMFVGAIEPPVDIISFPRSFNKYLTDVVEIPDKVVEACEATVDEMLATLDVQIQFLGGEKGPKAVLYGFSRVASSFISPKKFELFWPHLKKIAEAIIDKGCIVQFHLDNDYTDFLEYFTEFPKGKTWFHLDTTDIFKAKEILGDRACLMGDLPPQITGLGTPQEVEDYCKKQIEGCMEGGGYILCSSCVLPDNIPAENIKAMKDSVMKYGFYRA